MLKAKTIHKFSPICQNLIVLVITIVLNNFSTVAQVSDVSQLPNFTPPSPTAYELGKYGQISVGLFTGTPKINIPLYEYHTRNLTVPISLSYNSNGLKVDQLASNVGLGWSLNMGGVIARITRDKSDEENNYFFPQEEISEAGARSPLALDFFYLAGMDEVDTETDLFMYNFNGYTGKFVFDNDRKIVQLPKKDLKIENYEEGGTIGFKITTPQGIVYTFLEEEVTTNRISGGGHSVPDYPTTTAWYLTRIEHPKGDIVNFVYANNNYSYVGGKDQFLQVSAPTYQSSCEGSTGTGVGYTIYPSSSSTYNYNITHVGKRLIEINSNFSENGKVTMASNVSHPEISGHNLVTDITIQDKVAQVIESFSFNYLITNNKRVFLEDISFLDPDKSYQFEYFDPFGFIDRLSFSQDHWGYYNGKSNNYLFPNPQYLGPLVPLELSEHAIGADKSIDVDYAIKGLLKKVTYPTKGFNEFSYESHTYRGKETVESDKTSLSLTADTGEFERGAEFDDTVPLWVPYNQEVEVYLSAYFNDYICGPHLNTGKAKATFSIIEDNTGNYVPLFKKSSSGYITSPSNTFTVGPDNNDKIYANLEGGKNYTVRLHPAFDCVTTGATIWYRDKALQVVHKNINKGGLRVKTMTSFNSETDITNTYRYYYGKKEAIGISTGEKGPTPYYFSNTTKRIACSTACSYSDITYLNLNSNTLRSLYNSSGTNTTSYNYVTVSEGGDNFENGGTEHEFIIHNDYPGNPLFGDAIESAVWTNFGWSNGLKKRTSVFKKEAPDNFIVLSETVNDYKEDPRLFDEVYGYAVRKKFNLICEGEITYECKEEDLNKVYEYHYCATDHKHLWGALPFVEGWRCTRFDSDNRVDYRPHPCNNNSSEVGEIITYPNYIENLDIMEYKSISYWHYLDSSTSVKYDEKGLNPVTTVTKYFYDNPSHMQITRQETIDSKNNIRVSKIYYPGDVRNIFDLGYNDLTLAEYNSIDKLKKVQNNGENGQYHIATPVQIEINIKDANGSLLSQSVQRTNFKQKGNLILPEVVQSSKDSGSLEERLRFHKYDSKGNPLELSKSDGAHTVYIWGYNDQYPIAKIENATHDQVANELNALSGDLSNINETDMSSIDALRTNLPNAMVTTYTYEPLVGVESITDPKGRTTTYHYDSFNRLEFIKDEEGNILKEYKYHYKR